MLTLLLVPLAASLAWITYGRLEARGPRTLGSDAPPSGRLGRSRCIARQPQLSRALDSRPPLVLLDASLSMLADPPLACGRRHGARARTRALVRRPPTVDRLDPGSRAKRPGAGPRVRRGRRSADRGRDRRGAGRCGGCAGGPPRGHRVRRAPANEGPRPRDPAGPRTGARNGGRHDHRARGPRVQRGGGARERAGKRESGRAGRWDSPVAVLPPDGTVPVRIAAGTRGIAVGTQILSVGIDGAGDAEPRNDTRLVAVDFSGTPGIVLLASPGDWDARFLYRAAARCRRPAGQGIRPARGRVGGATWTDSRQSGPPRVRAAAAGADLLVVRGEAPPSSTPRRHGVLLRWPEVESGGGEWYASAAPVSPVALAFLGVPVESLPPLTSVRALTPGRRGVGRAGGAAGAPRRRPSGHPREAGRETAGSDLVGADGLWRWGFRGGPSGDVYRAMVAATVSWLLAEPDSRRVPTRGSFSAWWRRAAADLRTDHGFDGLAPRHLRTAGGQTLRDTLRFGGDGRAAVWLPPGIYRYQLSGPRGGTGLAAVDRWSREWLPREAVVQPSAVPAAGAGDRRTARQSPWLVPARAAGAGGGVDGTPTARSALSSVVRFPP